MNMDYAIFLAGIGSYLITLMFLISFGIKRKN
jgi:hypothetical protein